MFCLMGLYSAPCRYEATGVLRAFSAGGEKWVDVFPEWKRLFSWNILSLFWPVAHTSFDKFRRPCIMLYERLRKRSCASLKIKSFPKIFRSHKSLKIVIIVAFGERGLALTSRISFQIVSCRFHHKLHSV